MSRSPSLLSPRRALAAHLIAFGLALPAGCGADGDQAAKAPAVRSAGARKAVARKSAKAPKVPGGELAAQGPTAAGGAAPAVGRETDAPIPQDAAKRAARDRDMIALSERTFAEAYEKVGRKDPRWDDQARALMALAVKRFSGLADLSVRYDQVFAAAKDAIDLGCDDPMVLYLYARTSIGSDYPGEEEYELRMSAAARALEKSQYPPIRRAAPLALAAQLKAAHEEDPEARKEAGRMADAVLALLPESLKVDGAGVAASIIWYGNVLEVLQVRTLLDGDSKAAYDKVDAALAGCPAATPIRLQVRASFYNGYAWEARGSGYAHTVSQTAFTDFTDRLEESRRALEEAWAVHPDDAQTATLMLTVELGIGGDRDRMELWFRRAMEADPDNKVACLAKLDWLEPKWHGSAESLLSFARACRDTRNWRSGIPLLLPDAHYRVASYLDAPSRAAYYRTPSFWQDVRGVYQGYLERFPDDTVARSEFAAYSYLSGHPFVAQKHFDRLGPALAGTSRFPEDWLRRARDDCARKTRGGKPAVKGPAV